MPLSKRRNRDRMREVRLHKHLDTQLTMRLRERALRPLRVCEACGYSLTVDTHHEGKLREEHTLCPNCHGLITRHILTLEQLLSPYQSKPVQPKPANKVEIDADGNIIYEE